MSAASESSALAAVRSVDFSTRDMSLRATPQLYSAEWEDGFIFHAALYLSHACTTVRRVALYPFFHLHLWAKNGKQLTALSSLRHWAAFAANTLGHTWTVMWPDALCSPSLAAASALCATTPCGMPALGGQGRDCRQTQSLRGSSEQPWHSAAPRRPARVCCGQLT